MSNDLIIEILTLIVMLCVLVLCFMFGMFYEHSRRRSHK